MIHRIMRSLEGIKSGYSERKCRLKYMVGVGYQWRYDDGEPWSPVFETQLEAKMLERREHGELVNIIGRQP